MDYMPVAATLAVGALVATGMILIDYVLGPRKPNPAKESMYECGIPMPAEDARAGMHVKFFGVALLFLLFDVETVFLFPVAVQFRAQPFLAFAEVALFAAVLVVGFAYAWRKGGLEWD